ncbi:MAG: YgaP-like transmembrane domain [Chitinophagaceae bacterium]
MKKNIGFVDSIIRIIIAASLIIAYSKQIVTGAVALMVLVLLVIIIATVIFQTCPLYFLFGMNTCSSKKKSKS